MDADDDMDGRDRGAETPAAAGPGKPMPDEGSSEEESSRGLRYSRRWFLVILGAGAAGLAGLSRLLGGHEGPPATNDPSSERFFPVRTVDSESEATIEQWRIEVDGLVERPLSIASAAWRSLPRREETVDFHCVEGWSVSDVRWSGVLVSDVLAEARPTPEATHVVFHAYDGTYVDSLPLDQALDQLTLLADSLDGSPLPPAHGGPVRLVVPRQLAYKSVKFVRRLELTDHLVKGYWEARGYPSDAPVES